MGGFSVHFVFADRPTIDNPGRVPSIHQGSSEQVWAPPAMETKIRGSGTMNL